MCCIDSTTFTLPSYTVVLSLILQRPLVQNQAPHPPCPPPLSGMVVIGDPTAETVWHVSLSGGNTLVTPNVHYLPTSDADRSGARPGRSQPSRLPGASPLPALSFLMDASTIETTKAMYSGNATPSAPQKSRTEMVFCELSAKTLEIDGADVRGTSTTRPVQFLHSPRVQLSKRWWAEPVAGAEPEDCQTYDQQLDVDEASCTVTTDQLAGVACVVGSWQRDSLALSDQPRLARIQQERGRLARSRLARGTTTYLHMQSRGTVLTRAWSREHTLVSATIGSCSSAVIVEEAATQRLCHMAPVFHGPLDTRAWSSVEAFQQLPRPPPAETRGMVLECSMSTPLEGFAGAST